MNSRCLVQNCKTTAFNKAAHVMLLPLPTSTDMRNKWLNVLRSHCSSIDWNRSRICSKHFENQYFDSQRQLKHNAIPTLFSSMQQVLQKSTKSIKQSSDTPILRTKLDRLLNALTQTELQADIKQTMRQILRMPENVSHSVNDELQCHPNTPIETQLWVLVKKQDHLITRLLQGALQNKKHIEVLQKNMEESRNKKKEMEKAMENYKYIAKCLQEKHATLEEQIKLLSAIECRTE